MFQYHYESFGSLTQLYVSSADGSQSMSILPSVGACLRQLVLDRVELLDGDQTDAEALANRWSKGRLLFPFPNRLRDGQYEWNGQQYQFPVNDMAAGNALHGMCLDKPFVVESIQLTAEEGTVTCVWHYGGDIASYPFPADFRVTYTLRKGSLQVTLACLNTGEQPIPVGMGWHPYFAPGGRADDYTCQLPILQIIGVDDRMLPTGERHDYPQFAVGKALGDAMIDNCFWLADTSSRAVTMLEGSNGCIEYWQETGEGKFPFMQLFIPPDRQSVAIEPMSCNVDAFNNLEGLIVLHAGQLAEASCGLFFRRTDSSR